MADGKTCRRKYEAENRDFLVEWELSYFFLSRYGINHCVLCQATISHFKASNLQRHFKACHSKIDVEYPLGSELRKSHSRSWNNSLRSKQRYCHSNSAKVMREWRRLHSMWAGTWHGPASHTLMVSSSNSAYTTVWRDFGLMTKVCIQMLKICSFYVIQLSTA